jgi:hypothetical protein
MSIPEPPGEALTAALIQIASHAERIASLDTREHGHHEQLTARLRETAAQAAQAVTRADASREGQAAVAASLDALDRQVAALAARLAALPAGSDDDDDGQRYEPVPAPRWWNLTGPERETAVGRLHAWVEQVYRPCYGQLAALLPRCWAEHPLCLFTLDWLSELWSVLYLGTTRSDRILAAQAEWQTRLLPGAADQMAADADGCPHRSGTRQPPRTPATGP